MPRARFALVDVPGLYRRIGYDAGAEARGFQNLADLDLDECRAAFELLVSGMSLDDIGNHDREVILLLLDILQRVNRRVHRPSSDGGAYRRHRAMLIQQFAELEDGEAARRAFLPLLDRLVARLKPGNLSTHHLVRGAQAFIEENYPRRISLSSVADHLHVSPNYLSRVFKKETATTLTSYTHAVRMEHAMVLLAAGGRTISEIAYLVGYQNYRDFYRNFVKLKNASPRQFQRLLTPALPSGTAASLEGA
jgi:AraC-like DNA-binding protein